MPAPTIDRDPFVFVAATPSVPVAAFTPSVSVRTVLPFTVLVGEKVYANVPGTAVFAVKVLLRIDPKTVVDDDSAAVVAVDAGVADPTLLGIVVRTGAAGAA